MSSVIEVLQTAGIFLAGGVARLALVVGVALVVFLPLLLVAAAARGAAALLRDGRMALGHRRRRVRPAR
jgi:hypothetical protein